MRNKLITVVLTMTVASIFGLINCKKAEKKVDPAAVWKEITETSDYTKWSFWPDHKGMQPGKAPHGPFHKVYVNDLALNAKTVPFPDGAIVVKENYSKEKKLAAITIMKKIKGYNPEGGDWYWVKYSPEGKADKAGKVQGCIKCHGAHKMNDYVFVHMIKY